MSETVDVVKIETVNNKSGKGTHPVVEIAGHKYPYHTSYKLAEVFGSGPGKYKITFKTDGKFINIENAEFVESPKDNTVSSATIIKNDNFGHRAMVASSALKTVADITVAIITSNYFDDAVKDAEITDRDPREKAKRFASALLASLLFEIDTYFGYEVKSAAGAYKDDAGQTHEPVGQ